MRHSLADWDIDGWSRVPFKDNDEIRAAMSDRRYRSSTGGDAFRAAVERKLALAIEDSSGHDTQHESYRPVLGAEPTYRAVGLSTRIIDPLTGQRDAEAEKAQRDDLADATRALGEALCPLAIKPSTEVIGEAEPFEGLPVDVV